MEGGFILPSTTIEPAYVDSWWVVEDFITGSAAAVPFYVEERQVAMGSSIRCASVFQLFVDEVRWWQNLQNMACLGDLALRL